MYGGLPTPRTPAERVGERVLAKDGRDVTAEYRNGAAAAVRLAQLTGCTAAVLKANSPSCGCGTIYDGTFTGRKIPGSGVTAEALRAAGLAIYNEETYTELL